MTQANSRRLAAALAAFWALLAGVSLAKGGLFIAKHEGDMLHHVDILMRMANGEIPHLDFMTPIGVLAFAPFLLPYALGAGVGLSILLGQALVGMVLLPAAWWVGRTRFPGPAGYIFGVAIVVLCLALVHGEAEESLSISMHYNRWAWALTFIVLPLALIAPDTARPAPRLEGAMIGLALAALALIKATYLVAFAPPIILALVLRRAWGVLGAASVAGLVVGGVVTLWAGPAFWAAYIGDLMLVGASDTRPAPGAPLVGVVAAPAYKLVSLLALLSVVFLRQAGRSREGLLLLTLFPGFVFVTYQNFGNDPKWALLLALLVFVLRPTAERTNGFGWHMRPVMGATSVALMAAVASSWINMAFSPFSHLQVATDDYVALLPTTPDLRMPGNRAYRVYETHKATEVEAALDQMAAAGQDRIAKTLAALGTPPDGEAPEITSFAGAPIGTCSLQSGLVGWFRVVSDDLAQAGYADAPVLSADLLSVSWLYGAPARLPGGAPWYYDGLPGLSGAEYLLVPRCAVAPGVRASILAEIQALDLPVRVVRDTDLYRLYALGGPKAQSAR